MLKDITESKRSDTHSWRKRSPRPRFHTTILSRLFRSAMKDEVFNVPPKIYEPQRRNKRAFESLKKRNLTWIQGVELEPEDHII